MDGNTVIFMAFLGLCSLPSCSPKGHHVIRDAKTWSDAQSYCRKQYTDLLTISSMDDMALLSDTLQGDDGPFWIGLYGDFDNWMWAQEGESHEVDGKTEQLFWKPGEPDMNSGSFACVHTNNKGQWSDDDCSRALPSICIKDNSLSFPSKESNWTKARGFCQRAFEDLATLKTPDDNSGLFYMVRSVSWIGLYRVSWKWSDGQKIDMTSFLKWKDGSPKEIKNSCATTTHSEWQEQKCSNKYAFVCMGDPVGVKQVRVKVTLTVPDSSVDLEDMQDSVLQQFSKRLEDHGMAGQVNLKWMKQPDGKIFSLKETEEEKKHEQTEFEGENMQICIKE